MKLLTELDSLDNVKDGETRKLITKTSSSGSGNVVSSVSVSGDTITYTKGVTALTAHQNAFSKVKVGSTEVGADSAGDTLELVAGSNVTLTPDATNDKVTIAATDTNTTYTFATGDATGQIKITPSGGSAQNVTVKDLGGPVYAVISITKPLTVGTEWMDTGVVGSDLGSSGSFIVQLSGAQSGQGGLWGEIFTGVTSNYASTTNSGESDEILLQNTGHAPNSGDLFLRWVRTSRSQDGHLKLQIASAKAFTQEQNMVFKFRRMI